MAEGFKIDQEHGKGRVRVSRVWRRVGGVGDLIVEWNVSVSLASDCLPAYTAGDNSTIVATDSIKNTVSLRPLSSIDILLSWLDLLCKFGISVSHVA